MKSNAKQFESKPMTISADGLILRNGIARVTPGTDPETGLPTFKVYDPREKSQYRTCFLHVELFRLYSGIEDIPRLDPEDVEFIEGDRMHVNNLQLTESGRRKVYGSDGTGDPVEGETGSKGDGEIDSESSGDDPDESVTDPSQGDSSNDDDGESSDSEGDVDSDEGTSETLAPSEEDESSDDDPDEGTSETLAPSEEDAVDEEGASDEGTSETLAPDDDTSPQPSPEGEGVDDSSDGESETVFAVKGNGAFYLLEDADGNDLLPKYNDGSQINGKKNVRAIAEEYGLDLRFK